LVSLAPDGRCSHQSCPAYRRPVNRDSAPRDYHSQRCARQDQTLEIDSYSESDKKQEAEHKFKIWDKNIKPLNVALARITCRGSGEEKGEESTEEVPDEDIDFSGVGEEDTSKVQD
jgi:hypothetical protein